MKTLVAAVLLFTCLLGQSQEKRPINQYGKQSEFLFADKFNPKQGSFEIWAKFNFDNTDNFQVDKGYSAGSFQLFSIRDKNGNDLSKLFSASPSINLSLRDLSSGHYVSMSTWMATIKGRPVALNFSFDKLGWKKSGWHYFAITWKRTGKKFKFTLTCDDKTKAVTADVVKITPVKKSYLSIGSVSHSVGTIEAFQIHKSVLSKKDLAKSFKKGIKKSSSAVLYMDSNELIKIKELKISKKELYSMSQNTSASPIRIPQGICVFNKPKVTKGNFMDKAIKLNEKDKK